LSGKRGIVLASEVENGDKILLHIISPFGISVSRLQ
jgi:hypothetical protein